MRSLFFLLIFCSLGFAFEANVFFIVIDGVRNEEISGTANDDFGQRVSAKELFPFLTGVKKHGLFFPNVTISNPYGVSLPAYADLFTGRREKGINSNDASPHDLKTLAPTLFEEAFRQLTLTKESVLVSASWQKICTLSFPHEEDPAQKGTLSCGWKKGESLKKEAYDDARSDADTFVLTSQLIKKHHPKLGFVHFGDADEEAHLQKSVNKKTGEAYGIFHYHAALQKADYYIRRLWEQIETDPLYTGKTYLFVTTDHGRDGENWSDHGHCLFCSDFRKSFAFVLGPGVPQGVEVSASYDHRDITVSVAKALGVELKSATGRTMKEIFGTQRTLSNVVSQPK